MYFVFRIQNTDEPVIPLSEAHRLLEDRDDSLSKLHDARIRIIELEREIKRLNENPLERYLKLADETRTSILLDLQRSMKNVPGINEGDVRVIPEQGILRLSGDMLFPRGVSSISPGSPSDNAVRSLAIALSKVLPCFSLGPASLPNKTCNPNAVFIDAVFVEGHTDNVPITGLLDGSIKDNLSLSARRAINTVQTLYADQPQLGQMFSISPSQEGRELGSGNSPLINPSAFGDTRPAFTNDTEEGRKSNRRIDLRLLMYSPKTASLIEVRKLLDR
jgi:outer membrane protein OmpA-like peptidoglycan-associated protein